MSTCMESGACELCCTRLENFGVVVGGKVLLHGVNLHIHCGELTVLIGPNGAGKTTLLRAILGEVPHTGSLVFLDAKNVRSGRPLIGYVPQRLDFDQGSPASVLDFCAACISRAPVWLARPHQVYDRVKASLARVQADHLIGRRLGNLSGGELQRVLLACALDPTPDLLMLDEPVTGVDLRGMELFYNMVSELREQYDLSIILVSHDLNLASQFADRFVLLNRTVLASGPPDKVMGSEAFLNTFGAALSAFGWPRRVAGAGHHREVLHP